jgi:nucleotide-binding universal stress UspA family protein
MQEESVSARAETPTPLASAASREHVALHRDVLLACDASPAALAATRIVGALTSRWSMTPHIVTVLPPPPTVADPIGVNAVFGATLQRELASEVRSQLAAAGCGASVWPHEMSIGSPAGEIVRIAQTRGSDLIVLGLRPHTFLDRVFRDETALSVMRHAGVPVLAVTPSLVRLPRRIAVAIDFSRASIAAARAALTLLDPGGALQLVYVEPPREPATEDVEGFGIVYAQGVAAAFARLRHDLTSRADVAVETVVLHGEVAPELLSFAERADVDVLAVGSQRHSVARRTFVGGVTTALARSARKSLLVIPPGRRPEG